MRISHKHRLVFLANPRTGSMTVRNILNGHSDIKSIKISEADEGSPFYHHISAAELARIFERQEWEWSGYRRFCVVRNPFDRVVSLYHHHQKRITRRPEQSGTARDLSQKVKRMIKPSASFRNYVMQINPANRLTTSLRAFVCDDNGNFLVEDILRFENLTEELTGYLNRSGIHIRPEEIPHLHATRDRRDYREYYDEATMKRVAELYAYEIDRFGYSF